jgi:hypothetical protein
MNSIKLLFIAVLLFSVSSNAQLDKKVWLVGGSGSFDSYKQVYSLPQSSAGWTYDYKEINVTATIGYFFINKLVIGVKPEFSYLKGIGKEQTGDIATPTKLIVGPFIRYYLLNKEKPFNIFAETSYQTGLNNIPLTTAGKGNYTKFSVMTGTEIFFNSSVGLEILLGYKATKETIGNPSVPYIDTRKGLQLAVGFQIHLEKI